MSATLALGTAQFGTPYGVANSVGRLDDATVAAILAAAFELGVRVIDTAAAYGDAEERIGRINLPHDAVVCSKLPPGGDVRASVEASRRRLRRDRIDYYLVHRAGDVTAQLVDHLAAEHAAGHIGAAGISVYTADEAALLDSHAALSAIQFPYNLLDRRITPPAGATCFARSALLQGLFVLDPDALPANVRHAAPTLRRLHSLLRDF
ncbi:MAG: aldo/keto reductase, partial [Planctomycetota bacterium]